MDKVLQNKVEARIDDCLEFAKHKYGLSLPRPQVTYNLSGRCAGRAYYWLWKIEINTEILKNNEEDYLRNTVPHEFAHLLTDQLYGENVKPHGREWKNVMRAMSIIGVNDVYARHNYDTSSLDVRRKRRYIYTCSCNKEIVIGPTRHRRHQETGRYFCRKCGDTIQYVKEHPENANIKSAAQNKKSNKNGYRKNSKIEKARVLILSMNQHRTRKQIMSVLCEQLDISKNTAHTYYYKILNENK